MNEHVDDDFLLEAFCLLEGDIRGWIDAARDCMKVANTVRDAVAAEPLLLAAVYYERATKLRRRLAVLKSHAEVSS